MAEFKVNDALTDEVSAFSSTGKEMNSAVSDVGMGGGISTLIAGTRFVIEYNSIMRVMELYQQLIEKDAEDLMQMKETTDRFDEAVAYAIRSISSISRRDPPILEGEVSAITSAVVGSDGDGGGGGGEAI